MARREDLLKDPDRMAIRRFGGKATLAFGMVFVVAGAGILVTLVRDGAFETAPILVAFAFAVAGLGFGLSKSEVILDRRQRLAVSWWGLLRPLRVKSRPLDALDKVVIGRVVRTSSSNSGGTRRYVVYPVRLEGTGEKPLDLGETQDLMDARRRAEEAAKFLSLPVHDHSDGDAVRIREAGTLDEPLAARLKREGGIPHPGPPPEGSRLRIEERPGRFTVRVPLPVSLAQTLFLLAFAMAPLVMLAIVRGRFDGFGEQEWFIRLFMIAFLVVWMSFTLLPLVHRLTRREQLVISHGRLTQERRSIFGRRRTEIPLGEIEEIALTRPAGGLGKKRVLSATSDAALIQVGGKLDEHALEWLKRRLLAEIAST